MKSSLKKSISKITKLGKKEKAMEAILGRKNL